MRGKTCWITKKENAPLGFELLCVSAELCPLFTPCFPSLSFSHQNSSAGHLRVLSIAVALCPYIPRPVERRDRATLCSDVFFSPHAPGFPHHILHIKTHTFDLKFVFKALLSSESHARLAFIILSHLQYFPVTDARVATAHVDIHGMCWRTV